MNLFLHLKQLHPTVHVQFRDTPPEVTERCIKAGEDYCSSGMGKDIAVIKEYKKWLFETFGPKQTKEMDLVQALEFNIKLNHLSDEVKLLEAYVYMHGAHSPKERVITTVLCRV